MDNRVAARNRPQVPRPTRLLRPAFDLRLWPLAALLWLSCAVVICTRSMMLATQLTTILLASALLSSGVAMRTSTQSTMRGGSVATVCLSSAASNCALTCLGSAAATALTASRVHRADYHDLSTWQGGATKIHGVLAADPSPTRKEGTDILRLQVPDMPGEVAVFANSTHTQELSVGDPVAVVGQVEGASRAGIAPVTVSTSSPIEIIGEPSALFAVAAQARRALSSLAENSLGSNTAGLVTGMVFGDVRQQPSEQRQYLLDAGLAHLSAVSGANVTLVTASILLLSAALGLRPQFRVVAAAATLALYVLITGPEPSVLRAAVMGGVGLIAIFASRRNQPLSALAAGIIALLIFSPDLAVSWGFGLSVGVTLGLVLLAPFIRLCLMRVGLVNRLPKLLLNAMSVGIAAEVVSIPLLIVMSGTVPVGSVLANLLVNFAVAPVTVLGLIAAVVVWVPGIGPPLATTTLWLAWPFAWWIDSVAHIIAQLPGAVVHIGQDSS